MRTLEIGSKTHSKFGRSALGNGRRYVSIRIVFIIDGLRRIEISRFDALAALERKYEKSWEVLRKILI